MLYSGHNHQVVTGSVKDKVTGKHVKLSRAAGSYPLVLCQKWASLVAQSAKPDKYLLQHAQSMLP